MTDEELQAIEKACAEATPGPWMFTDGRAPVHYGGPEFYLVLRDGRIAATDKQEDAKFIAYAREAVPALVEEVRLMRSEAKRLAAELGEVGRMNAMFRSALKGKP